MGLYADLVDAAHTETGRGTADWRARRIADHVMTVLARRRLLPDEGQPPPGVYNLRRYLRLPPPQRQWVDAFLLRRRVGYWMWRTLILGPTPWVELWVQHPRGGPLWGHTWDGPGPLTVWRQLGRGEP